MYFLIIINLYLLVYFLLLRLHLLLRCCCYISFLIVVSSSSTSSYPHRVFLSFIYPDLYWGAAAGSDSMSSSSPTGGATPFSIISIWLLCMCGVWFAPPLPSGDVCSKRTSANLIVAIPLLIAIRRKEEVTTQSAGQDVWQQHCRYILSMMLQYRQQRRNIR